MSPTERDSKPSERFEEFRLRHSLLIVRSYSLADFSAVRRTNSLVANCVLRLRDDAVSPDDRFFATVDVEISEVVFAHRPKSEIRA
jgi:hypothetical protein